MNRRVLVAAAALLTLAGCAAKVVSSTPRQVIINAGKPPTSGAQAQRLADAECKSHGRFARMVGRPSDFSDEYVFECVQ